MVRTATFSGDSSVPQFRVQMMKSPSDFRPENDSRLLPDNVKISLMIFLERRQVHVLEAARPVAENSVQVKIVVIRIS